MELAWVLHMDTQARMGMPLITRAKVEVAMSATCSSTQLKSHRAKTSPSWLAMLQFGWMNDCERALRICSSATQLPMIFMTMKATTRISRNKIQALFKCATMRPSSGTMAQQEWWEMRMRWPKARVSLAWGAPKLTVSTLYLVMAQSVSLSTNLLMVASLTSALALKWLQWRTSPKRWRLADQILIVTTMLNLLQFRSVNDMPTYSEKSDHGLNS